MSENDARTPAWRELSNIPALPDVRQEAERLLNSTFEPAVGDWDWELKACNVIRALLALLAAQQEEHAAREKIIEVYESQLTRTDSALAAALAEVERLTRINVTVNGLAMYARHKDDCPATFTENARVDREPDVCNCGLAALAGPTEAQG